MADKTTIEKLKAFVTSNRPYRSEYDAQEVTQRGGDYGEYAAKDDARDDLLDELEDLIKELEND